MVESASVVGSEQPSAPQLDVASESVTSASHNGSRLRINRSIGFESDFWQDQEWVRREAEGGATWLSLASNRAGVPIDLAITFVGPGTNLRAIRRHESADTAIVEIYVIANDRSEASFKSSIRNAVSTGLHESLHLGASNDASATEEEYLATLFEVCFLTAALSQDDRLHLPATAPDRHAQSNVIRRSADGARQALAEAREIVQSEVVEGSDAEAREKMESFCRTTFSDELGLGNTSG